MEKNEMWKKKKKKKKIKKKKKKKWNVVIEMVFIINESYHYKMENLEYLICNLLKNKGV